MTLGLQNVLMFVLVAAVHNRLIAFHHLLIIGSGRTKFWFSSMLLSICCFSVIALFYFCLLWPPCIADADIIFLPCGFYLSICVSIFFPRLIPAAADWMSTILLHMVWP